MSLKKSVCAKHPRRDARGLLRGPLFSACTPLNVGWQGQLGELEPDLCTSQW